MLQIDPSNEIIDGVRKSPSQNSALAELPGGSSEPLRLGCLPPHPYSPAEIPPYARDTVQKTGMRNRTKDN